MPSELKDGFYLYVGMVDGHTCKHACIQSISTVFQFACKKWTKMFLQDAVQFLLSL